MIPEDLLPMLDDPTFTDDQIAELAEITVADVAAARAKKAALLAALEPPAPKRTRAKPAEAAPAAAEPAAEPSDEPPASVRVTVGEAFIKLPDVRAPRRVAFRDVYGGDFARYLWTHHRAIVEPYGA